MDEIKKQRKSSMKIGNVYFWTSTIYYWKNLLNYDPFKQSIIESLHYLSDRSKIKVYGFVIMPNHIHLLWEMMELNGKEMPHASFQKFTAHFFKKELSEKFPDLLKKHHVNEKERSYRFWQDDALAIHVEHKWVAEQKLKYIHLNPLQDHWNLSDCPENYYWSSAAFYEKNVKDFMFLTHYMDRF